MIRALKIFAQLFLVVFIVSCNQNGSGDGLGDVDTSDFSSGSAKDVKKIFYNVPSPVEMTGIVQRAGASYNGAILNKIRNVEKYNTNSTMALNLGVYGADLSYTRLFDQIQESVNYLAAIRKLSDGLGIPQEQGKFAISRIEKNIEIRDSLLKIITEVYGAADMFLKENNRGSTANLIILGGWTEALYIATNLIDESEKNNEVLERIAEQKYSLKNLIELLSTYKTDAVIAQYLPMLNELDEIFNSIESTHSKTEVKTDSVNGKTTLDNKSKMNITSEDIVKIKTTVSKIREKIIK